MSETTQVMRIGVEEIKRLRAENEILAAKVSVMNLFAALIMPKNDLNQTMQVDPVWRMERVLETLEKVEAVTSRLHGHSIPGAGQGAVSFGEMNAKMAAQREAEMDQQVTQAVDAQFAEVEQDSPSF